MSYTKETPLGLDSSAKEVSLEINESKTKISNQYTTQVKPDFRSL